MLFPAVSLTAGVVVKDTYVGAWSPYTLLLCLFIVFTSLVLLVVLIVSGMTGRFRKKPPAPPEDDHLQPAGGRAYYNIPDEELLEEEAPPTKEPPPPGKTGLAELLVAFFCPIPALLVFSIVDNTSGQMVAATGGTALVLFLFAGQIFLIVRFVRAQRGRKT